MSEPTRQDDRKPDENEAARPAPKQQGHDHAPQGRHISGRGAIMVLLILLVVAVVIIVAGIIPRKRASAALKDNTDATAAPDVLAARPEKGAPDDEVVVPGNMYAFMDSPIYARTNGYLEHWYYDIGAHVKKGALLATISAPEIDQQLAQARANLATAEANAGFARTTAARYQNLLQADAVSRQDTENFTTQSRSSDTAVNAARASVQQYLALTSYEKIYAPFSGVITSRAIDTGQLIDSGANRELFHMAKTDMLRVYTNIPQIYSRSAIKGTMATIELAEYPGETFKGKLVRTANAIDPASRTLLTEIDVDNRDGRLVPGAYTVVHMKVNQAVPSLVLPVSTLIFQSPGLQVATVVHGSDGDRVKMVSVVLGHDDGKTVQVVSGLDENALVIDNPPDSLVDQELVHLVQPRGTIANQPGQNQTSKQAGDESGGQKDSGSKGK